MKDKLANDRELHNMLLEKYPHIPNNDNDEATERLNLIRLGKRDGYADAVKELQSIDIAKLVASHTDKMNKFFDETGDTPEWWDGIMTIPISAIKQLTKKQNYDGIHG